MSLFKITKSNISPYPGDWPPESYYVHESQVTRNQIEEFSALLKANVSEKIIDSFFTKNPVFLTMLLGYTSTGHHGAWVIPKRVLRTRLSAVEPGLIPDFIVGGKSSSGFDWFIVELKGANENVFAESNGRVHFSSVVNRGICQVLEYMDYSDKIQAHLRDDLKMTQFRRPKGFLVIGKENETLTATRRQHLKSAWNHEVNSIQIRSYNAVLRLSETAYEKTKARV